MNLSKEEQALIRLSLLALQEKDADTLAEVNALGTLKGTEEIRNQLFDRIDEARELHVKFLKEMETNG